VNNKFKKILKENLGSVVKEMCGKPKRHVTGNEEVKNNG